MDTEPTWGLFGPAPVQTLIIVTQSIHSQGESGSLYTGATANTHTYTRSDQLHGARHNATGSWLCNYGLDWWGCAPSLCLGSTSVIPAGCNERLGAESPPYPIWSLCSRILLQVTGICLFTIQRRTPEGGFNGARILKIADLAHRTSAFKTQRRSFRSRLTFELSLF